MRMNFEVMRMIFTEQRTAVKMMKSRNTCGSIEMSRRDAADCCLTRSWRMRGCLKNREV